MKTKMLLAVVLAVLLAGVAQATPDGEYIVTATGGVRICRQVSPGPIRIDMKADGDATVKLISTSRGDRLWPEDTLGISGAVFNLRDGFPRPFYTATDKVDSLYFDISGGATEVIVTWEME